MKANKSYEQLLAEQKAAERPPRDEQLADVLFKGNIVDRIVPCKACGCRNRVKANRGAARCAGCGLPLGEGTPAPPAGMDAWLLEKARGNQAATMFMGANPAAQPYYGTDRTVTADTLRRTAPRSLWTRIADAWHAARSAWKWGPG